MGIWAINSIIAIFLSLLLIGSSDMDGFGPPEQTFHVIVTTPGK